MCRGLFDLRDRLAHRGVAGRLEQLTLDSAWSCQRTASILFTLREVCSPLWIGAKVLKALIAGGFALVHQQVDQGFLGSWLVGIQCSVDTVFHAVLFEQLYGATAEALNKAL